MIQNNQPVCDWCQKPMQIITVNEDGDEVWPWRHAHAHVCNECFDETFGAEWKADNPCKTMCETKPCKRGRDCWYMPPSMRNLPYETYFADRVQE